MPPFELYWQQDYAQRYMHYLTDADLREVRRSGVCIGQATDDHEVSNNYFEGGSPSHDSDENIFSTRRENAVKVWADFMPVRSRVSGGRSYRVNDDILVLVLDTRSEAEQEVTPSTDLWDLHDPEIWFEDDNTIPTTPGEASPDFRMPTAGSPDFLALINARQAMLQRIESRRLMSSTQEQWLRQQIFDSNASKIIVSCTGPAIAERFFFWSSCFARN